MSFFGQERESLDWSHSEVGCAESALLILEVVLQVLVNL